MIHEYLMELKKVDDRIRLLKDLIDDARGIKTRMPRGLPSSGIGKPTESQAIRLAELKDELSQTSQRSKRLSEKLQKEKNECRDELLWKLMWDHFYQGYTWEKTAIGHNMKESAVKMRFARFLKKSKWHDSGRKGLDHEKRNGGQDAA